MVNNREARCQGRRDVCFEHEFERCERNVNVAGGAVHRRDVPLPAGAAGARHGHAAPRAHHGGQRDAPRHLAEHR